MRPIEIGQIVVLGIAVIGAIVLIALPNVEVPAELWGVVGTLITRETVGLAAGRVKSGALTRHRDALSIALLVGLATAWGCDWEGKHCDNVAKAIRAMESTVVQHRAQCGPLDGDKRKTCERLLSAHIGGLEQTRRAYTIECTETPVGPGTGGEVQ